jgi:hypothetical protein
MATHCSARSLFIGRRTEWPSPLLQYVTGVQRMNRIESNQSYYGEGVAVAVAVAV